MRITGSSDQPSVDPRSARPVDSTGRTRPSGDSVDIRSRHPAVTERVTRQETDRAARIAQIRSNIRNGAYAVDLQRLATAIADDELARLGGG